MAEALELSSANRIRQLAGIPVEAEPPPKQEEPPAWSEIKASEDYKTLTYPEQVDLARQWGAETKQYASTLPDYTPEQDVEIDDFVNKEAVDVPANVKATALRAGLIKGSASVMGGIAGGLGGAVVGGPIGAVVGGIGGSIAGGELAEAGLQKFTPKTARAREFAPGYAAAGQYAPEVVMGTVGARQLVQAGKTLFQELGAKRAAQELGKAVGVSAGVSAAVGSGVRAVTGSEVTPGTVAEDALFGALYAGIGSGSRVKGYNREQALNLNERVKSGRASEVEYRDWQGILAEAERTQARGVESAKRTEVELGGRKVFQKTELTQGAQPETRPVPTAELPSPRPAGLQEIGVVESPKTVIDSTRPSINDFYNKLEKHDWSYKFSDSSDAYNIGSAQEEEIQQIIKQGGSKYKKLYEDYYKYAFGKSDIKPEIPKELLPTSAEIVREGPIVTPRTQLPTTERLALPAGEQPIIETKTAQTIEPLKQVETGKTKIIDLYEKYDSAEEDMTEADIAYRLRNILDESDVPGTSKLNEILGKYEEAQQVDQFEYGKRSGEPEFYADQLLSELGKFTAQQKTTIPRPMRGKAGEAGFIVSDVQEGAAKVAQKWLTTEGNLPKEMFDIMEAKGSRTQAMLKQIDFTLKDLAKAARELNGKPKLTQDQSLQVDQFLRGYLPAENLPEAIRPVVQQMRRQLDNLSEGLIQVGAFSQEVGPSGMSKADIIRMNKGEYLTRSYEKFDNPKYDVKLVRQRNPALYAEAENFVRTQMKAANPATTEAEVQGKIKEYIEGGRDKPFESLIQASGIGKKLGITKARQDIPEQVRFLMGEYTDPVINYARSASKMINLLQSQEQLNKLKEFGVANKLFFERPTGNAATQIAADGSDTRSPLNGLYAEKDLVDAIENFEMTYKQGGFYQLYAAANAWVKWGKTVGSIQAQFRNPISNVLIEVANGNIAFGGTSKPFRAVLAEFGVPKMDTKEGRAYLTRATQLGIYDNTVLNEFTQMLKDAQQYKGSTVDFAEELAGKGGNIAKKGVAALNKTYRAGDNLFKLMAWENETKQLMDGRGLSRQDAEVIAAERVRNTRPTYSRVPRIVKAMRLQPFFGNFISWPSEMLRIIPNTLRYAAEDLKTPGMRRYGFERLVGVLAATTATVAITRLGMWATGFNDRKMDALRRFVAPYQKNATLMPTGADGKDVGYVDISYTDPYEVFKGPALAAASGKDPEESIANAILDFLESYIGPSILANSIVSALSGRTPQGRTIVNPQDTRLDQTLDRASYLLRQNEPATVSQFRRIYYALTGQPDTTVSKYGRIYKPSEELSALFGIRPQSINVSKALESKASRFNTDMADVGRIFTETYGAVGNVPEAKVREQFDKMQNRRKIMFDEANKDFHAAMLLGLSRSEAISAMRAGGMGVDNASAIANNRYRDYKISKSLTKSMRRELSPEEMQKRQEIGRELMMQQGE
jgi:hypothetical protein